MIHIILPAYNSADTLPSVLDGIREVEWAETEAYTVVVVDDGSTDATVSVCRSRWDCMPLEVSCHLSRRGQGESLITGLKHCLSRSDSEDVVISMDADGTCSPALMPSLVRRIRQGSDVAIASRFAPGGMESGIPSSTRILNRCACAMLRAAFHIPGARDYTCCYRAYSAAILERAFGLFADGLISSSGCLCSPELLVKLASLGARVSEAPLVVRHDLQAAAGWAGHPGSMYNLLKLMTVNRPKAPPGSRCSMIGNRAGSRPGDPEG